MSTKLVQWNKFNYLIDLRVAFSFFSFTEWLFTVLSMLHWILYDIILFVFSCFRYMKGEEHHRPTDSSLWNPGVILNTLCWKCNPPCYRCLTEEHKKPFSQTPTILSLIKEYTFLFQPVSEHWRQFVTGTNYALKEETVSAGANVEWRAIVNQNGNIVSETAK